MRRRTHGGVPTGRTVKWVAVWRGLCPRCLSGRIFAGPLTMNETCPSCHLRFERERGYFVGAMYVSYALAVPLIGAMMALLSYRLVPGWPLHWVVLVAGVLFVPLVPVVFRYSRIVWIHFDRYLDDQE